MSSLHNRLRSHIKDDTFQARSEDSNDTIRRLKILSKSQTAFLKMYIQKKLDIADKSVKKALNLLNSISKINNDDSLYDSILDIKSELSGIRIDELNVANIEKLEIKFADEVALLKNSINLENNTAQTSSNNTLPPPPPTGNIDTSNNEAYSKLQSDYSKLEQILKETEKKKEMLVEQVHQLNSQNKELNSNSNTVVVPTASATEESSNSNEASEKEIQSLKQELMECKQKIKQLHDKESGLKETFENSKLHLEKQEMDFKDQINSLTRELSECKLQNEKDQRTIEMFNNEKEKTDSTMANISIEHLTLLKEEISDFQTRLKHLHAEDVENKERINAKELECRQLFHEKTQLEAEIEKIQQKTDEEIQKMKDVSTASESQKTEMETRLKSKESECAVHIKKIQSLELEMSNIATKHQRELNSEKQIITNLQKEKDALVEEFETEKEELMDALTQEIADVEAKGKEELDALNRKIQSLSDSLLKQQQSKKILLQNMKRSSQTIQTLKASQNQLKNDVSAQLRDMSHRMKAEYTPMVSRNMSKLVQGWDNMAVKYKKELAERKKLHNLVQELKGNIRVYMRCRPPTEREISQFGNDAKCVSFPPAEDGTSMAIKVYNEKGRDKTWEFEQVFDHNSTQESVYKEISELVVSMMDGYNVCIFAYGQTGSGKTFTMMGPPSNPGVNTRALGELFERSAARRAEYNDVITVSVLEVYNEQIRDLLVEGGGDKLEVRTGEHGNFVPGLTVVGVKSLQDVTQLLGIADSFRMQACTNMNEHSSRSHMMLTVYMQSENRMTGVVSRGKLNLVDLAGSERINKSGATGTALKEAQNINKSLSALGDVIQARGAKQNHVPFRNSTLTYLLQDSLSSDSKTLMFVCISPVIYNSEETFCSLNFAQRVRAVELGRAAKHSTAGGAGNAARKPSMR